MPPRSLVHEQGLVQTQSGDGADAVGIVVDQRRAVGQHRVVDGMPVTAQLDGDLVDRASPPPDLLGHPGPGPVGHDQMGGGDVQRLLGLGADRARRARTAPPALAPHQTSRRPIAGRSTSSTSGRSLTVTEPAPAGHRTVGPSLDVHPQTVRRPRRRRSRPVTAGRPANSSHMRVGSTSTGALPNSTTSTPPSSQSSCYAPGIVRPPLFRRVVLMKGKAQTSPLGVAVTALG